MTLNGKLMKSVISIFLVSAILGTIFLSASCKRSFSKKEAFALVDKISLSYGNNRIFNTFTITNAGDEALNYFVDEQIDWLEVASNKVGKVPGNSSLEITCRVSRVGLPQNNYYGLINIQTPTGNFRIEVFMMVDMFPVTFINPVFSTIAILVDTVEFQGANADFKRMIGTGDSTQFGFFAKPALIAYYCQTSGRYSDSTQLGLLMEWKGSRLLNNIPNPRFSLDISKAYFHLSIINTFQVLTPLIVNPGTPFEVLENIYISQSAIPQPIGYYQALGNSSIRAFIPGSSSSITWSNNNHFVLPETINQSVVVASYNSDTITKKMSPIPFKVISNLHMTIDSERIIRLFAEEKQ